MALIRGAIDDQALRWPLLIPLAMTLGAGVYMSLPFEPGWLPLGVWAAASLGPYAVLRLRGGGRAAFVCLLIFSAALGAIAGKARAVSVEAPVLLEQIGPVRIEGIVAEIDASERSRRVRIAVRAIENLTPEQTPRFVRFSYRGDMRFSPGRAVACRAILSPPPRPVVPGDYAFHRDAYFQQLGGVGFSVGPCEALATPPATTPVERAANWIGALRRSIAEYVFSVAGKKGGGMSAAMVAGDRSFITPDDSEALRVSGLAHLLSISGVHMVLAGGIFFFSIRYLWPLCEPLALRFPAVQVAALGAIIACTLYFAISGGEVATQRAYIIALIAFGAKLFDRPALSLRSVAVALGLIVLLQPEAVITPGFQMSFAASASLIALYEIWPRLERPQTPGAVSRILGWIVGATATSVTASLATLPFALHHFDRAAIFSVVANIVSTPVISFWTTPAAAAAAIAAPFGLQDVFLWTLGQSLEVVIAIAHASARLSPDIDLPRMPADGLVAAALGIGVFCVFNRAGRLIALIPLAFALASWTSSARPVGYIASDGTVFLDSGGAWLELTDWRGRNGLNPLIIGDVIQKSPCPGKGAPCRLALPSGVFQIMPPETRSVQGQAPTPGSAFAALVSTPRRTCPTRSARRFASPP